VFGSRSHAVNGQSQYSQSQPGHLIAKLWNQIFSTCQCVLVIWAGHDYLSTERIHLSLPGFRLDGALPSVASTPASTVPAPWRPDNRSYWPRGKYHMNLPTKPRCRCWCWCFRSCCYRRRYRCVSCPASCPAPYAVKWPRPPVN